MSLADFTDSACLDLRPICPTPTWSARSSTTAADPFPVHRHGPRALRRRQRPPGRALLLQRFRHDVRRLPRPRDRPPGLREYVLISGKARFLISGEVHAGTRSARRRPRTATG